MSRVCPLGRDSGPYQHRVHPPSVGAVWTCWSKCLSVEELVTSKTRRERGRDGGRGRQEVFEPGPESSGWTFEIPSRTYSKLEGTGKIGRTLI